MRRVRLGQSVGRGGSASVNDERSEERERASERERVRGGCMVGAGWGCGCPARLRRPFASRPGAAQRVRVRACGQSAVRLDGGRIHSTSVVDFCAMSAAAPPPATRRQPGADYRGGRVPTAEHAGHGARSRRASRAAVFVVPDF